MLWALLACGPSLPSPRSSASEDCGTCHEAAYTGWKRSHHALAERTTTEPWAAELGAKRVIGVEPVVQALVPMEDGRLQAHVRAFDPRDGSRFDVAEQTPGSWTHWTGGALTWNGRCARCHNTGVRKNYDGETFATTVDEHGVGCIACHPVHEPGSPSVNDRMEDTCAACHTRAAEITPRFEPGERFLDHYLPAFLTDTAVFAPDGRARDEAFEFNQFWASPMHAGGARCTSCHDPHSGALVRPEPDLCTVCHTEPHDADRCVDCHMPHNRLMARHDRRDHGFTSPGDRHEGFAALTRGEHVTVPDLNGLPRGRRAAWVHALGQLPGKALALRDALDDPDALVRTAAADAWTVRSARERPPLEGAADDPVRAVRVAAQRQLVRAGRPLSRAQDYRAYLDHNADDPSARSERGALRVRDGDPRGLDDLAAAVRMDDRPALRIAWATGLARVHRAESAIDVLEEGLQNAPDDAGLHEALGTALASDPTRAAQHFERAVTLEPHRARAWRNLALLRHQAGDLSGAQDAARQSLSLATDPELARWLDTLED